MKKVWAKLKPVLASPQLRPVEVWLIRAAVAWVAVRLGVTVDQLVK